MLLVLHNNLAAGGAINYVLDCQAGTVLLSGTNANLEFTTSGTDYVLECGSGTVNLIGTAAILQHTKFKSKKDRIIRRKSIIFGGGDEEEYLGKYSEEEEEQILTFIEIFMTTCQDY